MRSRGHSASTRIEGQVMGQALAARSRWPREASAGGGRVIIWSVIELSAFIDGRGWGWRGQVMIIWLTLPSRVAPVSRGWPCSPFATILALPNRRYDDAGIVVYAFHEGRLADQHARPDVQRERACPFSVAAAHGRAPQGRVTGPRREPNGMSPGGGRSGVKLAAAEQNVRLAPGTSQKVRRSALSKRVLRRSGALHRANEPVQYCCTPS